MNNRQFAIFLAVYLGGGFLLAVLFAGANPNATLAASWWDMLAMYGYLGWSLGGLFVAGWVVRG